MQAQLAADQQAAIDQAKWEAEQKAMGNFSAPSTPQIPFSASRPTLDQPQTPGEGAPTATLSLPVADSPVSIPVAPSAALPAPATPATPPPPPGQPRLGARYGAAGIIHDGLDTPQSPFSPLPQLPSPVPTKKHQTAQPQFGASPVTTPLSPSL